MADLSREMREMRDERERSCMLVHTLAVKAKARLGLRNNVSCIIYHVSYITCKIFHLSFIIYHLSLWSEMSSLDTRTSEFRLSLWWLLGIWDIRSAPALKFYPKPVAQWSKCLLLDPRNPSSSPRPDMNCQYYLMSGTSLTLVRQLCQGESCQQCPLKCYIAMSLVSPLFQLMLQYLTQFIY